ncbi:MAG: FecCD family ABC transporter permease [Flavobacteriales bacterium]
MKTSLIGIILLCLLLLAEFLLGSSSMTVSESWNALFGHGSSVHEMIIWNARVPRGLVALFAGGSLALAGLLMQTMFRNPLAGPSILGVSSGASLGTAIVVLSAGSIPVSFQGIGMISLGAWAGSTLILLTILLIARKLKASSTLILVGMMVSFFTGALVDALQFKATNESVRTFLNWGMGNFSSTTSTHAIILGIGLTLAAACAWRKHATWNRLLLGYDYAQSMGVSIPRAHMWLILISGGLTALVTAYCGPIGFIGLAIPHLIRSLFQTANHRITIFPTMIWGAAAALFCDILAHQLNLPLNTMTSLMGAPIVLFFLIRNPKGLIL